MEISRRLLSLGFTHRRGACRREGTESDDATDLSEHRTVEVQEVSAHKARVLLTLDVVVKGDFL